MAIAECRYASFETIKSVKNPITNSAGAKPCLTKLLNAGYLALGDNHSYNITVKCKNLLNENGFITEHLKTDFKGGFDSHQQKLSSVIWPVMFQEDYFHTLYPTFEQNGKPYLIPDACLIFKRGEAYKIDFVEVEESDKPDEYLKQKAEKYKVVFSDVNIWDKWWRKWSGVFGLKFPEVDKLKFTVKQYGGKPIDTFKFMEG
jgi:hypothetical protein